MRIYESMTKVFVGPFTVRVWRQESEPMFGPSAPVEEALAPLQEVQTRRPIYGNEIIKVLDAVDGVNAYEILSPDGHGLVVYTDWP